MTIQKAKILSKTKFWKKLTYKEIVEFQLFEERLCMPFDIFHKAMEKILKRPVFTHEFALNSEGLKKEFLKGKKPPTLKEIMELIPKEKRLGVFIKT